MANYRQIHVKIWKDNWFLDLTPEEKLLYVYLFSNELTSLSGIYQISLKVIAFETGLDYKWVVDAMLNFQAQGKIKYEDGYIWIKNLRKYHETSSPKVQTHINNDLDNIPNIPIKTQYIAYYQSDIPYPYPIDTESQEEEEEEKDKDKIKNKRKRKEPPTFTDLIPKDFNNHIFIDAWIGWVKYRREKKKSLTVSTAEKQIKLLSKVRLEQAVWTIDNSITNGWIGLFPDKYDGNRTTTKGHTGAIARAREREGLTNGN